MTLNYAREEDLILEATTDARRLGQLSLCFALGGSLDLLSDHLTSFDPHILHFSGHGVFDDAADTGMLLMEDASGGQHRVANHAFADVVERRQGSLRLVFLSSCQSALAPKHEGYADLAPRLLAAGVSAVLAMRTSVSDRSASDLAATLYSSIAKGDSMYGAITKSRIAIARSALNALEFAAPVLSLTDAFCLHFDRGDVQHPTTSAAELSGPTSVGHFVGRLSEMRVLQRNLDPESGSWRAAVVYGLPGMGKTMMVSRLAYRIRDRFHGVGLFTIGPDTTAHSILDELESLLVSSAGGGGPEAAAPLGSKASPTGRASVKERVEQLSAWVRQAHLLLIFDDVDSRTGATGVVDEIRALLGALIDCAGPSTRIILTSRFDFNPTVNHDTGDGIGHVGLGEMGTTESTYLVEGHSGQSRIPSSILNAIYQRFGGHPASLTLFAKHASPTPMEEWLSWLPALGDRSVSTALLDEIAQSLTDRAKLMCRNASVFAEAVPQQAYCLLMDHGDESECDSTIEELEQKGLVARVSAAGLVKMPRLVREWAIAGLSSDDLAELRKRAANYWLAISRETGSLRAGLHAYRYFFEAACFLEAYDVSDQVVDSLIRAGELSVAEEILMQSIETTHERRRGIALGRLASAHSRQGKTERALECAREALQTLSIYGDEHDRGATLHILGTLEEEAGNDEAASRLFEESLAIAEAVDDRSGMAACLHHLGGISRRRGDLLNAGAVSRKSLALAREAGDETGVSACLGLLAAICEAAGAYDEAREYVHESLAIAEGSHDRRTVAIQLHHLAVLEQKQGRFEQALGLYQRALAINRAIRNRSGIVTQLHQIGMLLEGQGDDRRARDYYEDALTSAEQLGDFAAEAAILHQLGNISTRENNLEGARRFHEEALALKRRLGNRGGVARSLHQLGMVYRLEGNLDKALELYEESNALAMELGEIADVVDGLLEIGNVHKARGDLDRAEQNYRASLSKSQDLGNLPGLARAVGALGLLFEERGQWAEAVNALLQALYMMQQLGLPDAEVIQAAARRLQQVMSEEAFSAAVPDLPFRATFDETLGMIVQQTIAAVVSGQRNDEWIDELRDLHGRALDHDVDFAGFLTQVIGLLTGGQADDLGHAVPQRFRSAWRAILMGVRP